MLPLELVGCYKRYKQDTNYIACWLATVAREHGHPLLSGMGSLDAPVPESGRPKGKAGKEAKEKTMNLDTAKKKHVLAIKDFVLLATFIAERKNPAVIVPASIESTLDRLIKLRSSFGSKMADLGINVDQVAHERHAFFVRVPEDVTHILRPRMTPHPSSVLPATGTPGPSTRGALAKIGGKFATLAVYEPSPVFIEEFDKAAREKVESKGNG